MKWEDLFTNLFTIYLPRELFTKHVNILSKKLAAVADEQLPACSFHPKNIHTPNTHTLSKEPRWTEKVSNQQRLRILPKQPRRCALMTRTTIMKSPLFRGNLDRINTHRFLSPTISVEINSLVRNFVRTGTISLLTWELWVGNWSIYLREKCRLNVEKMPRNWDLDFV